MNETFPGSYTAGAYEYLLNNEPTDIIETWSSRVQASGQLEISSRREAPGVAIDVTAVISAGLVISFDLSWITSAGLSIETQYALRENSLQTTRRQGSNAVERAEIELSDGDLFILSPLMRVYTGPVIARLLEAGGCGTVIVPSIGDPEDQDGLLRPGFSSRRARIMSERTELVCGDTPVACKLCEYTGDQYGAGSRFWLAGDDTLLRYAWQQAPGQCWDVRLVV